MTRPSQNPSLVTFAQHLQRSGVSMNEIARRTGIPRGSLHKLIGRATQPEFFDEDPLERSLHGEEPHTARFEDVATMDFFPTKFPVPQETLVLQELDHYNGNLAFD